MSRAFARLAVAALLMGPPVFSISAGPTQKSAPAAQSPVKPPATPAAAATWQALESQFKPEGDTQQQARQRIAFLKQLIRSFPKDQANILNACLTIAAQAEILGDSRQAAEFYARFLDRAPENDKRRLATGIKLIGNYAAAGESEQAGKVFDRLYAANPAETLALGEKACAVLARDRQNPAHAGDFRRLAGLAAVFRSGLLRQAGKPDQATRTALLNFARHERRGRAAIWMEEVKDKIPWDHSDAQTLLLGILGGMRSADCLVKAVMGNERLIGEGVDVSGRFEDHSFIMASQYPCKADQLMAWFGKTGFEEYRRTAAGFIHKLHRLYTSTRDASGKHWPPIGRFVDEQGKAYTYFEAPKLDRRRDIFPWDQSKSRHNSHGDFMDAWGLGMWELSKSGALLDPADRQTLVAVLQGMLEFQHRPYMLKDEGGICYWRTDEFCPLDPPKIPAPDWRFLGRDVIHAVLALVELDEDTRPWQESLKKFAAWYMRERPNRNDPLIEYTDLRAWDLAEFLEKTGDPALKTWLRANLPRLYRNRRQDPFLVIHGGTLIYSHLPVLEVLARIDPGEYRTLLRQVMRDHVTPYGFFQDGEYPTINISEQEALLDTLLTGWRQGALEAGEFRDGAEKIFLMWGNPRCHRDAEDWVIEPYPFQRKKRAWEASPYPGYPEGVRAEAYYKGLPQAYTMSFIYGGYSDGTFERENFNCLVQYTAPGGHLTPRIRYGRLATFNIMDSREQARARVVEEGGVHIMEVTCLEPEVPAGTPCVGVVKVTDQYYRHQSWREPTGYGVRQVLCEGWRLPFKVYGMFGYAAPPAVKGGEQDNVKVGILLRAEKPGRERKVQIVFEQI